MAEIALSITELQTMFTKPSIDSLLKLTPKAFERFIAYVFECAGYKVKDVSFDFGAGMDLELYSLNDFISKPVAYVQVKQYAPTSDSNGKVGSPAVLNFIGALANTGCSVGYIVTTSDFTQPAYQEALKAAGVRLVNGEHLLRFIHYVRNSRLKELIAPPIRPDYLFVGDNIIRRPINVTRVLTIANNKGGVGKTTTALNVALGLAEVNQRVLLVDMDSQANLTGALPYPQGNAANPPHLVDYFAGKKELAQLIRPTQFERIWLIPSQHTLRLIDTGVTAAPELELQFVADLHSDNIVPPLFQNTAFDWIILDTPPAMTFCTRVALAATHCVLAPSKPSAFADSGLDQMFDTAFAMYALVGSGVDIAGCVVTQWQKGTVMNDAYSNLKQNLEIQRKRLFKTKISYDLNIDKAQTKQKSLFGLSSKPSNAAVEYRELVKELIDHVSNAQ